MVFLKSGIAVPDAQSRFDLFALVASSGKSSRRKSVKRFDSLGFVL